MKKIFLLLIPIIFMNCATVSFYKNEDLTQETGLKFYHSKPYLLVEKSPQKDIKIKSTIIYLPDLENPTYAEIKPGFGSSDLKLDLENGVLKSYGFTSDNKIPETVGALAGSLTSVTGAYKTITEAIGILDGIDNSQEEETEQQSSDADKVKLLQKIEPDVKLTVKDLNKLKVTEPSDIALRDAVKADVSTIVQEIGNYDPSKIKEIAKGSERLEALHFGVADYAASLRARTVVIGGLNPDYPGDQWHHGLSKLVMTCRAYGLRAIDGPFGDFNDPEAYIAAAKRGAAIGIEGKWAIHPSQIELANDVFSPPEAEVNKAKRILEELDKAAKEGKGAAQLDGRMIDAASARMADNVVNIDKLINKK
ncbi:aldolase/citrate lyase family protein [uncultured Dokdonia sp.]|uniref:aldolase/citrate lyase family protein n=1 Tax=uncultured Dokdonia sp. TaxID=575653 RepID=UPI0026199499|nr:aldolase/citrate lyase family protein [uncultured Dokdonia sp.]